MRFEKWQALGNDYLIVEASDLSFPLTPAVVRRLCDRHTGPGADGVLELSPPDAPGFVARLRIFNPDGSEAELSGNGAREAILYLRRSGWTDAGRVLDPDGGGRDPADDPRRRPPAGSTWAARGCARTLPGGGPTAPARSPAALPARRSRQPAVRDPRRRRSRSSSALDLPAIGPAIEHDPQFPNRTNVSFWCADRRGGDPRADLRARRGGDAVVGHRRVRRGRRVRAAAAARSPVTVAARRRRARGRRRRVAAGRPDRLGRARLRGELSDELLAELR